MIKRIFNKHLRNYHEQDGPRFAVLDQYAPSAEKNSIKIVTYNIYYAKRIKKAKELLHQHKHLSGADVICLQEMDEHGVREIAEYLKCNYVYYPAVRHPGHDRNFGNAILSPHKIISDEKIILPYCDKRKLQRIAVGAKIQIGGKIVQVISIHMKVFLKSEHRTLQVKKIIDTVSSHQGSVIIAGDFNTFTKKGYEASIQPFLEKYYDLATHNVGWNYKHWYLLNKKSTLDHIFTKGFKVKETGKVSSHKASDHIPLWAEIAF